MIFRWSIWGEYKIKNIELLRYSILSFRKQFGENHNYIVYTDDEESLKNNLQGIAEIFSFNSYGENKYNVKSKATWMKWCPLVKLDIDQTEIYVDSDVFLLKYPEEIESFIANPKLKFAIMDEFYGQSWQHGAMQKKTTKDTPLVNAGLFIQKAGYSISNELSSEFDWWLKNIPKEEQTHHDEQGALAVALTNYFKKQELYVFPKDRYMLIGPNENKDLESLKNVTLFHAVYPKHPAFYKFKDYLNKILGL